jgi:TolB-like protein/Tfp pilus assembly protein PilF
VSAKPSLAVLPFTNMSGDPEQEYFSDGITEDITTALARNRSLVVMAWHSAFAYKGKAVDVRQIANELGCRYVVEGSVRRSDQRVRINAQLVEADTGNHLWAERYERQLEDVFAVQDQIALSIAGAIDPELAASESKRARAKAPENLGAWDYYQQGVWHMYRFTVEGLAEAKTLLERAIDLDENFAPAYARLSYVHIQHAWYGPHESRDDSLRQALACAKRAITLDDRDALGHFALGRVYALQGQHDMAIAELENAIDLNPSFAQGYFALAQALVFADRSDEALPLFEQAIHLSPHDPHMWTFLHVEGIAHYKLGQLGDAERSVRESIRQPNVTHLPFATLVSILGHENKLSEAATVMRELLEKKPEYSCSYAQDDFLFAGHPCLGEKFVGLYVAGLRKAGLPE